MPVSVGRVPLSDMGNVQSELTPNTKHKLDVDIRKQLQERRLRMDADFERTRRLAVAPAPVIAEDPVPVVSNPIIIPRHVPAAPSPQRAPVESKHMSPRRSANPVPLCASPAPIVAPVAAPAPEPVQDAEEAKPDGEKKERRRIKLDGSDGVIEKVCLVPERRAKKETDLRKQLLAKSKAKEANDALKAKPQPRPAQADIKPLPTTGAIPPPRLSGSPVRDVRREVVAMPAGPGLAPTQERLNALNALMSPPRPTGAAPAGVPGVRSRAPPAPPAAAVPSYPYHATARVPAYGLAPPAPVPVMPTRYGYGASALPLPGAGFAAPLAAPAPVPRAFGSDLEYARYVARMEYGY
eukprot:TRINITY_DN10017_c0_g1_i1.p2 TRINITY_DN10017_c0_g1~~TRINITY_DN10017_c0_g1_i1.p2  ORF type:complete len:352 (+),score=90.07 TRINITY_DN10017_c0_g1_i1:71-1126(+)